MISNDDLCILCEGRNQLINIIDKWSTLNKIKVNKLKSGIMIFKNNNNRNENNIEEYPIINPFASDCARAPALKYGYVITVTSSPGEVKGLMNINI